MSYPREKRGVANLTFFSLVSDTQLDWETSGDFLIYVEKTEEVNRSSWQFSFYPYPQKECKDLDIKTCQFAFQRFLIKVYPPLHPPPPTQSKPCVIAHKPAL